GKRKRVYPTVADPKLKTQNVASLEPKGRRGRARDVALPIDKARAAAVEALHAIEQSGGEGVTVSVIDHRRVSRSSVDAEIDPFARTRSLLDEAEQRQKDATP